MHTIGSDYGGSNAWKQGVLNLVVGYIEILLDHGMIYCFVKKNVLYFAQDGGRHKFTQGLL